MQRICAELRMYTQRMEFEWDEEKRQSNIRKHRIDYFDIEGLFDGGPTFTSSSHRSGEERFVTTAEFDSRVVTIVWTPRGDGIRIISVRRARDAEERNYRSL